jgi:hypothetical protein
MAISNNPISNPPPQIAGVEAGSGLLEDAKRLWNELTGLAHDTLHLAALETRLAGQSLVTMIAAGVMIAILLVTAWVGVVAAVVLSLISIGVVASLALLIAVVANLLFAFILYEVIRRKSQHLKWAATIRSLGLMSSVKQNLEKS